MTEQKNADSVTGKWEQITYWLMANPKWSSEDIFSELQRRSPDISTEKDPAPHLWLI